MLFAADIALDMLDLSHAGFREAHCTLGDDPRPGGRERVLNERVLNERVLNERVLNERSKAASVRWGQSNRATITAVPKKPGASLSCAWQRVVGPPTVRPGDACEQQDPSIEHTGE